MDPPSRVVRLQLQLMGEDAAPKELVRKCTSKGNEVVEIDNFRFVRKSRVPEPPHPEAASPQQPQQAELPAKGVSTPQPQLGQEDEASAGPGQHEQAQEQHTEQQQPQDEQQPEDQLQLEPPAPPSPPAPRPVDVAAEVAALLPFIPRGCPAALKASWLLEQALRLAVPQEDDAGTAVADAVLHHFQQGLDQRVAAAQQLLQEGGAAQLQAYDGLPPLVREQCASDRVAASLRAQLSQLQREEQQWLALQERYRSGDGAAATCGVTSREQEQKQLASGAPAQGEPSSAAGGGGGAAAAAADQPTVNLDALSAAQRRADMQLGFQIEALHGMLDKAERLVEQAQQACMMLQADYHKENFQSYAHVNSPQVLIKLLSQATQAAAAMDYVPSSQP